MRIIKIILIIPLIVFGFIGFGQSTDIVLSKKDTTKSDYFKDYSDHLLIKFGTVVKSYNLSIVNKSSNQTAEFMPPGITSLGGGVNYKWFGLFVAFGMPTSKENDYKYGKTTRLDAQFNIYSKKFGVDAILQTYKGFYLSNPKALDDWTENYFPQLPRMQAASLGVGGYYFFNNKKFSYKAAYVRNAVQTKSAGSFLLGGYFNLDYAGYEDGAFEQDSIVSFIPNMMSQELIDTFDIKTFTSKSYGISLGYTYTFVFFKKWFLNFSLVPGFGPKNLTVYNSKGENLTKAGVVSRVTVRAALGYDGENFQFGITSYSRTSSLVFENYEIKPGTSNFKVFFAKRFSINNQTKKKSSL